jgi:selenocysteine lyase/cysteine desulfurase
MGVDKIGKREKELTEITFNELEKIKELHILAANIKNRLGVFSFYVDNIHHNLFTKLLNDRFGIQVRGGCSCAGTYGHFLLDVGINLSKEITKMIEAGDLSLKPGWIRLSLHPTMTDNELLFIIGAIKDIIKNAGEWAGDYIYDNHTNEFHHRTFQEKMKSSYYHWFILDK